MSSNLPFRLGRRHFLLGAGGAALAIPFLSSLEKPAKAGSHVRVPRFFYLGTDHGGCWDPNFFPTSSTPHRAAVVGSHKAAYGALSAKVSNGRAAMSPVLTADSGVLTSALIAKINVLRGLDVPWYIAHNTGQHLGNFARNDNNGSDGAAVSALGMRPTIDQLMANSTSFYSKADLASTTLRSMIMNPGRQLSWAFANPAQGVGSTVQNVQGLSSSIQLFNSIFGAEIDTKPTRPPVVDKVLANYKSLRQSNTRLSSADKTRLDTHVSMLADLQSSLNAQLACTLPPVPTEDAQSHQNRATASEAAKWGQLFLDVVAAAFACNASRIGVLGWGDTSMFSNYTGTDWHHDVAHQWYFDDQQGWLTDSYQAIFEKAFLYLADKLDQLDDGHGESVLDNSLVVWSQECGMETHSSVGVQVVTAGSGAGYLQTGRLCDYRNIGEPGASVSFAKDAPTAANNPALRNYVTYPGLLYEQWLATAAQAMGLAPSEFELWKDGGGKAEHGVGTPFVGGGDTDPMVVHYKNTSSQYFKIASNPLPFLKA